MTKINSFGAGNLPCRFPACICRMTILNTAGKRQVIGILICLVVLCICPVLATQYTISSVQIGAAGNTATAELRIDAAPASGMSGYKINLNVADPSIAEITDVEYPSSLKGMTDTTDTPFTSGHVSWVDVNEKMQAGSSQTGILLATITIKGLSSGSTTIVPNLKMITDDKGNSLLPDSVINTPTVTVGGSTVTTTPSVTPLALPGQASRPKDPSGTGMNHDLNGDGTISYSDVSLYFSNFEWIQDNEPVALFDYNNNGIIDFGDIVALNEKV